jgi:hypothetical protein
VIQAIQLQSIGPWDIQGKLRIEGASNPDLQLLDLPVSYFTSFSTNPRGEIYGLIDLANNNEVNRYKIDYSAKLRQVLQYLVQFHQQYDLRYLCGFSVRHIRILSHLCVTGTWTAS